jgi:hypothetical protein
MERAGCIAQVLRGGLALGSPFGRVCEASEQGAKDFVLEEKLVTHRSTWQGHPVW